LALVKSVRDQGILKKTYGTEIYYPHVGDVGYFVKSVAERLVKKGHDVTVLCGESSIDNPREEWINGVNVFE